MSLTLTQRISLVFAVLLLACCGASAWLQIRSNDLREKEVVQDLSRGLAAHIARNAALMDADGMKPEGVRRLFGQLMAVNPSVEVYLLDDEGRVKGHDAPSGHLLRERVDLAPIRKFIAGDPLPILGDDPRSADGRKVFSAAALHAGSGGDGKGAPTGYIYVVLMGEAHDELAARASASSVLRTTLWSMGLVAVLGLIAGLTAFGLITRPLRRLTEQMRAFDTEMEAGVDADARPPALALSPPAHRSGDDIVALQTAFAQMAGRIDTQWRALTKQDQERRELVANISHDLRTPLTSLHGYLETLSLKADTLGEAERRRYLQIALAQSVKVGSLAQSLFELARLEHGMVQPAWEDFSLVDLVQDVFQKFELAAEARHVRLDASFPPR
jgi:signal transduction histidine kinase